MCARNAAGQRVLRPPRHDERVQAVRLVELVILQRVDDVEADQPQHDRQREHDHLQNFQRGNVRAFHRQPRADRRQRQREAEKNVRVIREPFGQRIKTNHHQRDRREVKAERIEKITGGDQARRRTRAQSAIALASEICPAGRWRLAVRGFSASNLRSTMRLNAIAQVRAQTIAARISPKVRQPGQPRLSRAATIIAASANGRAKTVCENRTNEAHFLIEENIEQSNIERRTSKFQPASPEG